MKKMMLLLLTLVSLRSIAQEIAGKVVDEKKLEVMGAVIRVYQDSVLKGATVADFDGNYSIKPLEPGTYSLVAISVGCDSVEWTNIIVGQQSRTTVNISLMQRSGNEPLTKTTGVHKSPSLVIENEPPLIACGGSYIISSCPLHYCSLNAPTSYPNGSSRFGHSVLNAEDIKKMPTTSVSDLVNWSPGHFQINGKRSEILYIIDGVQVRQFEGWD